MQTVLKSLFMGPLWVLFGIGVSALPLPLVQETGPSWESLASQAQEALAAGRFTAAEETYRVLLERDPGRIDAYRGLARALTGQGRSQWAAHVLAGLGEGLLQAGKHEIGVEVLAEAVELEPTQGALWGLLGKAHLLAENHLAARRALQRAVGAGDARQSTRLYLAAALWETGRTEAAAAIYRNLVEEGPQNLLALHELGRLLMWQGR